MAPDVLGRMERDPDHRQDRQQHQARDQNRAAGPSPSAPLAQGVVVTAAAGRVWGCPGHAQGRYAKAV